LNDLTEAFYIISHTSINEGNPISFAEGAIENTELAKFPAFFPFLLLLLALLYISSSAIIETSSCNILPSYIILNPNSLEIDISSSEGMAVEQFEE